MQVTTHKNLFLTYALLDVYGLARGDRDSHYLRRKTYEHFKSYKGKPLNQEQYGHHSKLVAFALSIEPAPSFKIIPQTTIDEYLAHDIKTGSVILSYLKDFYTQTDFEKFYTNEIVPFWIEEVKFIEGIVNRANLEQILDEAWQTHGKLETKVIPMPLEQESSGVGYSFNGVAYPVFGPPFNKDCLFLLAHECSHPRAKLILKDMWELINTKEYLFNELKKAESFQVNYNQWKTYFEEHLIRAMQLLELYPRIEPSDVRIENFLEREKERKGMIYIYTFYENLKKNRGKDLHETIKKIIEAL